MKNPKTLSHALELLGQEDKKWTPFAGGTDLMVLFENGKLSEGNFLNLWDLSELRKIVLDDKYLTFGALTTYSEIRKHVIFNKSFKMMVDASRLSGAIAIQNRGTIGGNICNASPAADTPPALLCYDAEIELKSHTNSRWIKYCDFHSGYKQMDLEPNELLTKIRIPLETRRFKEYYHKVGTRSAQAISKVCFAGKVITNHGTIEDIRLAWGSMAPAPTRTTTVEKFLIGKSLSPSIIRDSLSELKEELAPISDIRSTDRYRMKVAQNLLKHFLESAL